MTRPAWCIGRLRPTASRARKMTLLGRVVDGARPELRVKELYRGLTGVIRRSLRARGRRVVI